MIKIEIRGTRGEKKHLLEEMLRVVCYGITDEQELKLKNTQWDGHSGGDDAYFGLSGKNVQVVIK